MDPLPLTADLIPGTLIVWSEAVELIIAVDGKDSFSQLTDDGLGSDPALGARVVSVVLEEGEGAPHILDEYYQVLSRFPDADASAAPLVLVPSTEPPQAHEPQQGTAEERFMSPGR